ncbi:hypothetical protein H5410_047438 [Solanum commersonii]|uniref:Uncharacterized protein n=1 Tax=Solanum commersonii TaxID=4109 RepID=A0A9J5XIA3_SOLCO|nr:hypothetical protein H5410_047438 [Solanum commersonii]
MEHQLQQHHRVATHQVDVLEVNRLGQNRECSSFVEVLEWSCLPRRLSLQRTPEMFTVYIDRLMHMKNTIQSTSHGSSNPWYSQLKDVKAYKSDWKEESWYPVEHKSIDKTWRETQSISPFTPYYSKPSVCISGVIYQFVISDNEYAIAAFDVKSEIQT